MNRSERITGEMPYANPERQKEFQREFHQRNKQARAEQARKHKQANIEAIKKLKSAPCMDCGRSYPHFVMDFDHVRGEKLFVISWATRQTYALETILREIEKCELVCANCHRIRHHKDQ